MESMAELQAGALPAGAAMLGDGSHTAPVRRLAVLAELAPHLVPDCCGATATIWEEAAEPPVAATHPDLAGLVGRQLRSRDGPLGSAAATGRPVRMPDLLSDDRWPHYRAGALAVGVRASTTLPFRRECVLVLLTLYGLRPGSPEGAEPGPCELLGRLAADAIARDRSHRQALATVEQLHAALRSRPVVDQACGIVMYLTGCDAAAAFDLLRRVSQRTNRRLADLAGAVVATRRLPAGAAPHRPGGRQPRAGTPPA